MITYPCCKINLGLNVVAKRKDGYHDLETVFYPIELTDRLEANITDGTPNACSLSMSGNKIEGNAADNLIVKISIYRILASIWKKISLLKQDWEAVRLMQPTL